MILRLPLELFWSALILLTCALTGLSFLSRCFQDSFPSFLSRFLFSFGIGFAILSFLIFLLGCFGLLVPWAFVSLLVILLLLCHRQWGELVGGAREFSGTFSSALTGKFEIFLAVLFLVALLCNFLFNFTPATQVREMDYNLNFPKILLENRSFFGRTNENNLTLYYPFLLEMIYGMALSLSSPLLAKMLHYFFGVFSAFLLYELTARFLRKTAALSAMTIFYLMPLVTSVSGTANVELGTLFYGLLAVYGLLCWLEDREGKKNWLWLCAVMIGLSWQAKITGVSLFPAVLICVLAWLVLQRMESPAAIILKHEHQSLRSSVTSLSASPPVKTGVQFGLFVALGCSPWFLRNFFLQGNPFYPFPVKILGLEGHEYSNHFIQALTSDKARHTFWEVIRMHNNILLGDVVFGPGPLIFAFLIPALWLAREKSVKIIFLVAALFFLFHNLTFNTYFHRFSDTRFYILFYALCAALAAVGIEKTKELFRPAFVNSVVALGLLFPCTMLTVFFGATKLPLFFGRESEENFLKRKLQNYELVQYGNQHIPKSSNVLALGGVDAHAFYWNAMIVSPSLALFKEADEKRILDYLREHSISHILFGRKLYVRKEKSSVLSDSSGGGFDLHWNLEKLTKKYLKEVYATEEAFLYEVKFPEDQIAPVSGERRGRR